VKDFGYICLLTSDVNLSFKILFNLGSGSANAVTGNCTVKILCNAVHISRNNKKINIKELLS